MCAETNSHIKRASFDSNSNSSPWRKRLYLVGESTSGPWESTRDLCALAWTRPADRHLKRAWYNIRIKIHLKKNNYNNTVYHGYQLVSNLCLLLAPLLHEPVCFARPFEAHTVLGSVWWKTLSMKKLLRCIIVSYSCRFFWVYIIKWCKSWNTKAGNRNGLLRRWWGSREIERFKAIREVLFCGIRLNV